MNLKLIGLNMTLPILLISIFSSTTFAKPNKIQTIKLTNTSQTCQQAIDSVRKILFDKGYYSPTMGFSGIVNPRVYSDDDFIRENFYNYPVSRTKSIRFILTDTPQNSISNLFSSPLLMTNLGSQIMSACDQVGLVGFSYWIEGIYPVGYFPDGTARLFTLFDPSTTEDEMRPFQKTITSSSGERRIFQWGYIYTL